MPAYEKEDDEFIIVDNSSDDNDNNNNNKDENARVPRGIFILLILMNLATMADRAIIPGASKEFSTFCASADDSPFRESPDAGLGLLQASFVAGYSIAIILAGHYVHFVSWKSLVTTGMAIWIVAVILSGLSQPVDSYYMLLFSRMATGVSEASFHVVAPPMMQDRGGHHQGLWISIYLTAAPIGLAIGYILGSALSQNGEWQLAYYTTAIVSSPLLLILVCCIKDRSLLYDNHHHHHHQHDSSNHNNSTTTTTTMTEKKRFTFWEEIRHCIGSPPLMCITMASAALVSVVSVLGTFGGAFLLSLQLFEDETKAARWFGVAAAVAGLVGTPLGGNAIDRLLDQQSETASHNQILLSILPRTEYLILAGTLLCWPTVVMSSPLPFLTFLFFGWTCLFASQSGVTLSAMYSVTDEWRPNALAFMTLFSHLLGDVPANVLFGLLKDKLAPSCRIAQDGEFDNIDQCQEDHAGIRATLAVAYAWMTWCIVFFELAKMFTRRRVQQEEHNDGGQLTSSSSSNLDSNGNDGTAKVTQSPIV